MAFLGSLLKRGISLTNVVRRKKLNPLKLQKKTFIKLIGKARYTQFGQAFQFEDIENAAFFDEDKEFYRKFQANVPIYDYNKIYKEWWHRSMNGEKNVCWPGRVTYFALSSGTSEAATARTSRCPRRTSRRSPAKPAAR